MISLVILKLYIQKEGQRKDVPLIEPFQVAKHYVRHFLTDLSHWAYLSTGVKETEASRS